MRQTRLRNETFVFIPDVCDTHGIGYAFANLPNREEELLNMFDPASISVTLSKKLSVPIGRLRAWLSSSNGNPITGTFMHDEVENGEEVVCSGYILTSYCGFGVQIMVLCTKNSNQNWLKEFQYVDLLP